MRSTAQSDTAAELAIQIALHHRQLAYETNVSPLPASRRRADIVFREARVAVFVDGCFWHGCPEHGTWPKKNAAFWRAKIERNRERDADTNRHLEEAGWVVIRVWEHEDPDEVGARIQAVVQGRVPGVREAE